MNWSPIPSIDELMKAKFAEAMAADEKFTDLICRIKRTLNSEFWGGFCWVDITDVQMEHLQMAMFLSRRQGFGVSVFEPHQTQDGKAYLVLRDPKTIEDNRDQEQWQTAHSH